MYLEKFSMKKKDSSVNLGKADYGARGLRSFRVRNLFIDHNISKISFEMDSNKLSLKIKTKNGGQHIIR